MLRLKIPAMIAVLTAVTLVQPAVSAVPEANHVRIECSVLRLNVNDYTVRHQLKLTVTVARPSADELIGVENATLEATNPAGEKVTFQAAEYELKERTFKAANGILHFKFGTYREGTELRNGITLDVLPTHDMGAVH